MPEILPAWDITLNVYGPLTPQAQGSRPVSSLLLIFAANKSKTVKSSPASSKSQSKIHRCMRYKEVIRHGGQATTMMTIASCARTIKNNLLQLPTYFCQFFGWIILLVHSRVFLLGHPLSPKSGNAERWASPFAAT